MGKNTKWPLNIPLGYENTNIFHSKSFKNIPKMEFVANLATLDVLLDSADHSKIEPSCRL
jgi:hypothetical protein